MRVHYLKCMRTTSLLLCLVVFGVSCSREPSERETNLLKLKIESGQVPDFVRDQHSWEISRRVYELRNFRPVWVAKNRPIRVANLMAAIENADRDGLDPIGLGLRNIQKGLETISAS